MPKSAAELTAPAADPMAAAASLSREVRAERLQVLFRLDAATRGEIAVLVGEADRSQDFRDEGGDVDRGVARRVLRGLVGDGADADPRGREGLGRSEVGWVHVCGRRVVDKVRALIDVATPETDQELCDQAKGRTVRELADVARVNADRGARPDWRAPHEGRYLRFNDQHRTMTAQLPAESYELTRSWVDAMAEQVSCDSEAPLDQRRCDALTAVARSGSASTGTTTSPFSVVLHTPLDTLVTESGATGELAGELERGHLIDCATVQQIACDATIALALDDDVGHTVYEGRAKRFATQTQRREVKRRDRQCRFPGCAHAMFTNVHHIVPWKPGGTTDLPNLALLCEHHHGVVHRDGWTMSGDANGELHFGGPKGQVMVSRPSPLWARVTARSRAAPTEPSG